MNIYQGTLTLAHLHTNFLAAEDVIKYALLELAFTKVQHRRETNYHS